MSALTIILIGILFIAVAALGALVFAVTHAEEGYEDSSGYHRKQPSNDTPSSTVDTGNPWDQVEGACCPLDLDQSLGHKPIRQP